MRIGILTEIINNHSGSRAPLEIARHLALQKNEITIYAYDFMRDEKTQKSLERSGLKIVLFKKPAIPFLGKYIASIRLFKTILRDNPDIMTFSGTPPFFLAARLTLKPIIRIYQGVQFDAYLEKKIPGQKLSILDNCINRLANIVIFLIDLTSFRLSTGVIAISKYSKMEGKRLYKRSADKVIYHGTTLFKKIKNQKPSDRKKVNLISVSRLTPYKGFHLIIEALKMINTRKNVTLTIVGSQPQKKYLRYLKKIGPENMQIITNPQDIVLASLYRSTHIYVCADRYLYFGLPITEAAQFEIPTVTFNFAAANEIVDHGKTGYVAKNKQEFAFYLKKLIENTGLRQKLGIAARQKALQLFTWNNSAKNYLDVFQKITRTK